MEKKCRRPEVRIEENIHRRNEMKTAIRMTLIALFCALTALPSSAAVSQTTVILATTTSTQDSGLLDVLIPGFEKKTAIS
jgi:tungstate transport system substrate-binding protein